ncbi:hypothetical protein KM043_006772 [Ampulex compressa]|nr:hypothetical protein KM043_006772 [Ampulex compressa]
MKAKSAVILALHLALWALVGAKEARKDANSLENFEGKLIEEMDELEGKERIEIYGDMITLDKLADVRDEETVENDEDPIVSRVTRFLRNRRLQLNLPEDGSSADIFGRALGQRNVDVGFRALTEGASEGKSFGHRKPGVPLRRIRENEKRRRDPPKWATALSVLMVFRVSGTATGRRRRRRTLNESVWCRRKSSRRRMSIRAS